MEDCIKRIDIKEFRELGYLQELNRQFLHPLGLALEVLQNDDGTEMLGGVWDYRDDPEGMVYALSDSELQRVKLFKEKAENIESIQNYKHKEREKTVGYIIEPIPDLPNEDN